MLKYLSQSFSNFATAPKMKSKDQREFTCAGKREALLGFASALLGLAHSWFAWIKQETNSRKSLCGTPMISCFFFKIVTCSKLLVTPFRVHPKFENIGIRVLVCFELKKVGF